MEETNSKTCSVLSGHMLHKAVGNLLSNRSASDLNIIVLLGYISMEMEMQIQINLCMVQKSCWVMSKKMEMYGPKVNEVDLEL